MAPTNIALSSGSPRRLEAKLQSDLGLGYYGSRHFAAAVAAQRDAILLAPSEPLFHQRLAAALIEVQQLDEAAATARRAVELAPNDAASHHMMGRVLLARRQPLEAARSLREAVRLKPNLESTIDFARALSLIKRWQDADTMYRAALSFDPRSSVALHELSQLRMEHRLFKEALPLLAELLAIDPDDIIAKEMLLGALVGLGRLEESRSLLADLLTRQPDNAALWSHKIFTSMYDENLPLAEITDNARSFGKVSAHRVSKRTAFLNSLDRERRLRVGFVSGDFYKHPVGIFTRSMFQELDQGSYEVFVYATVRHDEAQTAPFRKIIPNWREAAYLTDDELESTIVTDGIDILFDLSGHTGGNRLGVFARKPAPVAVTWLGYFSTTGIEAIDYVLANDIVIPQGDEWQWVEKPWRMPETYLCFTQPDDDLPVSPLPAKSRGYITFGSANNINKLSDQTVLLWSNLLKAVPDSKLLLRTTGLGDAAVVGRTLTRFASHDIPSDRLVLQDTVRDYTEHLSRYADMDIALDPVPYNGGTTSVEALWMGVPVLTLRGDRYVARMGESILRNVGLLDWIAVDDADFVARGQAFAGDLAALEALRAQLRAKLQVSPMMDAVRFTRHFENALRGMWHAWCDAVEQPAGGRMSV